jgi:hypothetical protein
MPLLRTIDLLLGTQGERGARGAQRPLPFRRELPLLQAHRTYVQAQESLLLPVSVQPATGARRPAKRHIRAEPFMALSLRPVAIKSAKNAEDPSPTRDKAFIRL